MRHWIGREAAKIGLEEDESWGDVGGVLAEGGRGTRGGQRMVARRPQAPQPILDGKSPPSGIEEGDDVGVGATLNASEAVGEVEALKASRWDERGHGPSQEGSECDSPWRAWRVEDYDEAKAVRESLKWSPTWYCEQLPGEWEEFVTTYWRVHHGKGKEEARY